MAGHVAWGVNFFVALFALIDPIGCAPLFAVTTRGASPAARRLVSLYVAALALAFLVFFFLTGDALLEFFGISFPAFRIAGGALLFLTGLAMTRGELDEEVQGEIAPTPLGAQAYVRAHFGRLITPFAMPLVIGPGAISTVVIYAGDPLSRGLDGRLAGLAAMAAVCACLWGAFVASGVVVKALGRVGMSIVVRVLGLILCAMAVQFVIAGVAAATSGLIRGSTAHPYAAAKR